MDLPLLHQQHRQGRSARQAGRHEAGDDPEAALYLAVWAHADNDPETARHHARRARELDPRSEFARLFHLCLDREQAGVYHSPEAFRAFIRGGGNVGLYRATSLALRETYGRRGPHSLLDIGTGDGLALLPALRDPGPHTPRVDVVEPSAALLEQTTHALARQGLEHRAFATTAQEFAAAHPEGHWDMAQSTFALQSLSPQERAPVLSWLAGHTSALTVVEFDVHAASDPFDPAWFRSCLERLERGIGEYGADRDLVATGFILPVVLGGFATHARTNHEQSVQDWTRELRSAGFTEVEAHHLHDYWWQAAWIIHADHRRPPKA